MLAFLQLCLFMSELRFKEPLAVRRPQSRLQVVTQISRDKRAVITGEECGVGTVGKYTGQPKVK